MGVVFSVRLFFGAHLSSSFFFCFEKKKPKIFTGWLTYIMFSGNTWRNPQEQIILVVLSLFQNRNRYWIVIIRKNLKGQAERRSFARFKISQPTLLFIRKRRCLSDNLCSGAILSLKIKIYLQIQTLHCNKLLQCNMRTAFINKKENNIYFSLKETANIVM